MADINDPARAAAAAAGDGLPHEEVKLDLTKLNALSPEVISKQATVSGSYRGNSWSLTLWRLVFQINIGQYIVPYRLTTIDVKHELWLIESYRHHWTCRTREIVDSPSHLWGADGSVQE